MMLLAAVAAALSVAGCDKASDQVFGARVRNYLLNNPEVIEEVVAQLEQKRQVESAQRGKADIDRLRASIERDPRDVVINPNGKVTVVEFQDYRCGYCKLAGPQMVKLVKENPNVRFVIKEMPIFGGVSNNAAAIALAAKPTGKSLDIYQHFLASKDLNDGEIDRILTGLGLDPTTLRRQAAAPEVQRHLADNHQLARQLDIQGTPNFVIGDKRIVGADIAALQRAISEAS